MWTQLVDADGFLSVSVGLTSKLLSGVFSLPRVVLCKQGHRPVIPHLDKKNKRNCTNQSSACLASGHSKKTTTKKTLGLSYQSVSLHLPLHTSAGIVATAGPMTSFNIQVLWKGAGGGGGGVQSRQVREREFIIQTLLLPSCTFHLSACEIEPLPVLHIYCDPITLPHIQASDESCCSSSSAILKRKKMSQFTTLHTHRHTPAAHIGTPTQTHTQSANLPPYPSVLCPSGLIVHSR